MIYVNNNLYLICTKNYKDKDIISYYERDSIIKEDSRYKYYFKKRIIADIVYDTVPVLFNLSMNPFSSKNLIFNRIDNIRKDFFSNKLTILFYDKNFNKFMLNLSIHGSYFIKLNSVKLSNTYKVKKKIWLDYVVPYFQFFID